MSRCTRGNDEDLRLTLWNVRPPVQAEVLGVAGRPLCTASLITSNNVSGRADQRRHSSLLSRIIGSFKCVAV